MLAIASVPDNKLQFSMRATWQRASVSLPPKRLRPNATPADWKASSTQAQLAGNNMSRRVRA